MSLNNDLALAARRLNLVAEKLPAEEQSDLAEAWAELSDQVADLPEHEARAVIAESGFGNLRGETAPGPTEDKTERTRCSPARTLTHRP